MPKILICGSWNFSYHQVNIYLYP